MSRILCITTAWLIACVAPAIKAEPLSYEPVALAWSADEVARASINNLRDITRRAAGQQQLGCKQYCHRLQTIYKRLLPWARTQSNSAARLNWSLTVVRLPDIDAMALPGGQIIISEHFIRRHQLTDEELAFVLAHEMAHSILEHERQALTFARMLLPRQVPRTVDDIYTEMEFNFQLLKALEPVMQQGELEADELGLLLAARAGYAPDQQIRFIAREARWAPTTRALVSTHPSAKLRLERLVERLPLARRLVRR